MRGGPEAVGGQRAVGSQPRSLTGGLPKAWVGRQRMRRSGAPGLTGLSRSPLCWSRSRQGTLCTPQFPPLLPGQGCRLAAAVGTVRWSFAPRQALSAGNAAQALLPQADMLAGRRWW